MSVTTSFMRIKQRLNTYLAFGQAPQRRHELSISWHRPTSVDIAPNEPLYVHPSQAFKPIRFPVHAEPFDRAQGRLRRGAETVSSCSLDFARDERNYLKNECVPLPKWPANAGYPPRDERNCLKNESVPLPKWPANAGYPPRDERNVSFPKVSHKRWSARTKGTPIGVNRVEFMETVTWTFRERGRFPLEGTGLFFSFVLRCYWTFQTTVPLQLDELKHPARIS